jgi:hypothetical protein
MNLIDEWHSVELPASVRQVVTMLSMEERQFLYALARDYWTGDGAIVDAGCFLGGSTLALAMGVLANPRQLEKNGAIHSYDLFVADSHQVASYLKRFGVFAPGDSVRPVFDRQTLDVKTLLTVHEGDLRAFPWADGAPIEVLFIDVSKSWELNDFIVREFFGALIPGRSIVIQQDYVHPTCPWLAVTMEYLSDYFEPIAYVPYNSMVYRATQPVPTALLTTDVISSLSDDEKRAVMDRAIARSATVLGPDDLVELEAARTLMILSMQGAEAARADLARVRTTYAASPRFARAAQWVDTRLAAARSV